MRRQVNQGSGSEALCNFLETSVYPFPRPILRPFALATGIALSVAASAAPAAIDCKENPPPKVVAVFVDLSDSVKVADVNTIYRPTLRSLLDATCPGDRLVLSEISEKNLGAFRPLVDVELAVFPDDTSATQSSARRKRNEFLDGAMRMLSAKTVSKATVIMDSLNASDEVLKRDRRKEKWVLLLSDMLEESKDINFLRTELRPAKIDAVIDQRKKAGLMPNLSGVRVFVAGAAAPTTAKFNEVKQFWLKFIASSGAQMADENYSRVAIKF
jgi:hypothetical protein